ncbi:hypothetical protein L504_1834, partial [Bordetella bronchiseptica F2]
MRSGCLHDRPHTRRVCARREQDSAGACPRGKDQDSAGACLRGGQAPRIRQVPVSAGDRHPGFGRCLSPMRGQAPGCITLSLPAPR